MNMDEAAARAWNTILNRYEVDTDDIDKYIFHEKLKGNINFHEEIRIRELYDRKRN